MMPSADNLYLMQNREKPFLPEREIICGRQPVREMLTAGRRKIHAVYYSPKTERDRLFEETIELAHKTRAKITKTDSMALDRIAGTASHQGIAAEVSPYPAMEMNDLLAMLEKRRNPTVVILDHIQDPQNLGALLRTAEFAGVDAVVLPKRRACGVTPAAVRASAGASEHVKTAVVANIGETIRRLKDTGMRIAGLDMESSAALYYEADLSPPIGLVIGSEGEGIQQLVRGLCDIIVRIPQFGKVSSLNASAAGAIAIFEVVRQRSIKSRLTSGPP